MLTYRALLDDAAHTLYESCDTPRIDAEVLLQHVLQQPLAWLIANGDTAATQDHSKRFYDLVAQRLSGQPIAYLLGYREFWTLNLTVNEHVLIPRPDTECLVEAALERLNKEEPSRLLDLGTGSGAIGLALAKEQPLAKVLAVDYSTDALAVAKANALSNHVSNIEFAQSDWFSNVDRHPGFHLIAANPPYVAEGDAHLEQGDLRFEPKMALSCGNNGLSDLTTIIESAKDYLLSHGSLLLEHGHEQFSDVERLLKDNGYRDIELYKDLNQLPRCTAAIWPG